MKHYLTSCVLFSLLGLLAGWPAPAAAQVSAATQVYQYAVPVAGRTAYLWVPPRSRYVRGVVLALENSIERNWLEDSLIRHTAAEENLAVVWVADGQPTNINWQATPAGVAELDAMFRDMARVSGYAELEFAPLIVTGHSWNGRFAWTYAAARPARVIAAVPIRTFPLPDSLGFAGIPLCYIVGQTTELPQYADGRPGDRDFFWPVVRQTALALRRQRPENLLSVVVNPGGCHTDWTPDQSAFLALFIRKACRYRLPNEHPANGRVTLKKLAPATGWLTDSGNLEPDRFASAPYHRYAGNPQQAYWFFDEEMARAAVRFNGDQQPRRPQMPTLVQLGDTLPVGLNGAAALRWLPQNDGVTFQVSDGFLRRVPAGLTTAGAALGHAAGPGRCYPVAGPVEQVDAHTFRVRFDRQAPRAIALMADQPGDAAYRRATQRVMLSLPAELKQGQPQLITFPPLPDQPAGTASLLLSATAESGLPVQYYVRAGPALVVGNKLVFTPVPVKSRYPVRVEVVACQLGRVTAPAFQTAAPVSRKVYITAPKINK